jgi:hypothetical protein
MGSMSASDAAPLPRLGEVFFDVRGSSRSMRLSWYSDTGVAVFSIWQGGTCTGTFRLPMDDLPRMIDALQRGPRGSGLPGADARDGTGERARRGLTAAPADPAMTAVSSFPDYATGQSQAVTGEFRAPGADDVAAGPSGGYQPEPYRDRGPAVPEPSFQPYPDQDVPPAYRDSGPQPYRDDPLGMGGAGGYREEPGPAYRDSEPAYGDDPLGMSGPNDRYREDLTPYRDEPYRPSYQDEPTAAYQNDPRGRGYADDPFPSVYPEDAGDRGYRDDPRSGSHPYGREQRAPRGRS